MKPIFDGDTLVGYLELGKEISTDILGQLTGTDNSKAMDLRTGTILEAEKVSKTKKLIKMLVDLGFEKRTIVPGTSHFISTSNTK